jgi:hypothetical protein
MILLKKIICLLKGHDYMDILKSDPFDNGILVINQCKRCKKIRPFLKMLRDALK